MMCSAVEGRLSLPLDRVIFDNLVVNFNFCFGSCRTGNKTCRFCFDRQRRHWSDRPFLCCYYAATGAGESFVSNQASLRLSKYH